MATTTKKRGKAKDDYFELVRRFPLRTIRTSAEHDEAMKVSADSRSMKKAPSATASRTISMR